MASLPNVKIGLLDPAHPRFGSKSDQPFIIGVSGGTASGKTTVCEAISQKLGDQRMVIISQDSFYRNLTHSELDSVQGYNFDHPDAFDWPAVVEVLKGLKSGRRVEIPQYSFVTHTRLKETTSVYGVDVILFEGILSFFRPEIRDQMDMKIFVDTDADTRLSRRVIRDIRERGRTLEGVLKQYESFVKPSFDEYILPTKKFADVIIPRGSDNVVAIDLIVQHVHGKLVAKNPITNSTPSRGRPKSRIPAQDTGGGDLFEME
eukprot:TRINITY_DN4254_c0_g1_i2.p1 TRINITY_DN4254_c0_g1~~TRINITY_DN4254_c0_g1_i2.p1  ORF type:complete len:261 (-),score=48.25 TRINITY_DN4254_c0_g1_i2:71-853(-)